MRWRQLGKNISIACGLIALTGGTAFASTTWKLDSAFGGGPYHASEVRLAKLVKFLTHGRLNIQVFTGGTLSNPFKVTETVQKGIAQIGHLWPGYDYGVDKTSVLFAGYPNGLGQDEMLDWIYDGGGLQLWQKWRMKRFGVVAFPCNNLTKEVFLHSKKPIRTAADFKGLKIRTVGAWPDIVKKLGAVPIAMPAQDIYEALQRGVVDAAEWASLSVNVSYGLNKAAKYIIFPGIHSPSATQECVINKDAWNALGKRDQKLFAEAARIMTAYTWLRLRNDDAEAYQKALKSGNVMMNLAPSFIEKIKKLSNEWQDEMASKDPWFKKILDSQRAFRKLWSGAPRYQ